MGSGNGLVPSGNKPLPESMLTQIFLPITWIKVGHVFYYTVWRRYDLLLFVAVSLAPLAVRRCLRRWLDGMTWQHQLRGCHAQVPRLRRCCLQNIHHVTNSYIDLFFIITNLFVFDVLYDWLIAPLIQRSTYHWFTDSMSYLFYSQYPGCWWPGNIRSQGISSNGVDLVSLECSNCIVYI